MVREEMLSKLRTIEFKYIDPLSEWEEIGFTERPIWVNSKGYGYLSCDDPSDIFWEGMIPDNWCALRKKLSEGLLSMSDIAGTSLGELLQTITCEDFSEEFVVSEILDELLKFPEDFRGKLFVMNSSEGWYYFTSEDEFREAYERDWCDVSWEELDDKDLVCWIERLFNTAI